MTFRTIDHSDQWSFGLMTIRTNDHSDHYPSDHWPFGLMTLRTIAHSDQWPFGLLAIRTNDHSEYRPVTEKRGHESRCVTSWIYVEAQWHECMNESRLSLWLISRWSTFSSTGTVNLCNINCVICSDTHCSFGPPIVAQSMSCGGVRNHENGVSKFDVIHDFI